MTDKQVFLSYSLEDLETARHLVRAIEARGWAISWERNSQPDAIETRALREALIGADCVVVLWSAHSVHSHAVLDEAKLARDRGILVQAALDQSPLQAPFDLDEATPLTDAWSVTNLVRQIARVLDADATTPARESAEQVSPAEPEIHLEARVLEIAEARAEAGDLEQAITTYERWVEQKHDDMKAIRRLGDLYLAANREQDAASRYARVAEHYAAAGFIVPALETYKRIVELAPYSGEYRIRLNELMEEKALQTTGTQRAMSAVQFTIAAPPYVRAGESFAVDVWAHRDDDREEIAARLATRDEAGAGRPVEPASGSGPALTARLHIDGLDSDPSERSLRWDRGLGTTSFAIETSQVAAPGARSGVVGVYFLGLQIARIHFLVQVGEVDTAEQKIIPSRQERHTRAVASFAPEDREMVEARIRSFEREAPGVEVSLEAVDLRSHGDGLSRFLDMISAGDVMYLFWSESAARSVDVEREWRYALRLRGIDFIDPVPLVAPELAPPPPELSTLLGGDWHVAGLAAETRPRPTPPEAEP